MMSRFGARQIAAHQSDHGEMIQIQRKVRRQFRGTPDHRLGQIIVSAQHVGTVPRKAQRQRQQRVIIRDRGNSVVEV